jgi:hypothetical protein
VALHSDVVNKNADIIAGIRSSDIYRLWKIEQYLKNYKKRCNNDYKPKKALRQVYSKRREEGESSSWSKLKRRLCAPIWNNKLGQMFVVRFCDATYNIVRDSW